MYEDEDLQEIHEDIIELNEDISDLRRDLDNISASVEGTGENVTLNGTTEARFKKPPLPMGNSEQVQYSGKNLIPMINQEVTISGITFKAINGRLIINGTATNDITGSSFVNNNFMFHLNVGNYVLSRTNVNSNLTINLMASDTQLISRLVRSDTNLTASFNVTVEKDAYIGFYIPQNSSFSNYECGVMVSTDGGTYEPYVGGTASPNPDYPQEITNVTGDVEVVVENKNLFDASERTFNSTYNGDFVLIKDRNSKWYGYIDISKVKFPLTFSTFIYNSTSNISDTNLRISLRDKNKKEILFRAGTLVTSSNKKSVVTILQSDITDEMKYLTIGIRVQDGGYTENTQIEQGSTTTNYTEHKGQKYPLNLPTGKNKFGKALFDTTKWNITGTDEEFTIQAKQNQTTSQDIPYNFNSCIFTGTIDYENLNGSIALKDGDTTRASILSVFNNSSGTSNINAVAGITNNLRIIVYSQNSKITFKQCQLEEGETQKSYEVYGTTPIELCKIGDYQDYFYKESNKWYLHKEIRKITLDGSETEWHKNSLTFYLSGNFPKTLNALCSHFTKQYNTNWTSSDAIYRGKFTMGNIANQLKFMPIDENINTIEIWKTWLSTHNVTLYYALETPTDTEITDTTLISQLEAINNAISYDEQTNVSSNTIALFNVKAFKNMNTSIESLQSRIELLKGRS